MTWQSLLGYGLAKPGAWPDEPWEGDVVAKVGGAIPDDELLEAIDASYSAIVSKLPGKDRP